MATRYNFSDWIVFEDDDYVVVNKPPHLATLDDRAAPVSLLSLARQYHGSMQVCHRLDKETSGALLLAKNQAAYKAANTQFAARQIDKVYHALANGVAGFQEDTIELPLHISSSGKARISYRAGKPSVTHVKVLERFQQHTLLECRPVTGRLHQIRVHLAARQLPLVSDALYDGAPLLLSQIKKKYKAKAEQEERPLIGRVALHAYALGFTDMSGKKQIISTPYPKDFRVALQQLQKHASL